MGEGLGRRGKCSWGDEMGNSLMEIVMKMRDWVECVSNIFKKKKKRKKKEKRSV